MYLSFNLRLLFIFLGYYREQMINTSYSEMKGDEFMVTDFVIQRGDIGIGVNKLQAYLNMMQERGFITTNNFQDGVYGTRTESAVREWQQYKNLTVNGTIDYDTFTSLVDTLRELNIVTNIPLASRTFFLTQGSQGLSVFKMQEYLNEIAANNQCLRPIPVDGLYGPRTVAAVQQFQYLYDLTIDGVIGKASWDAIVNERNQIPQQ